ncbi:histidine-containing phosphotransfer protein 1-like isoform X4 [Camellia sinensis]|uniref:histidine-containing phosphotransfer protein 1-like isoform X4 n=1 Tax=Camellia sinensis TaxID=4442 RepID=UPI00103577AD|nr:histidine-containing phosphotransfer protein 1-like isoform X4 [Camellia sinensis]
MDGIRQLQRQLHNFPLSRGQYISQSCRDIYTTPLYREGLLDDQFRELQKLEDESNPEFVVEIVLLFFQVSEKLLNNLTSSLQEQIVDYKQVDAHVYQFKGSSSRCVRCLQQLKHEYNLVKSKLEALLRLEQKILAAGGSIPVMVQVELV